MVAAFRRSACAASALTGVTSSWRTVLPMTSTANDVRVAAVSKDVGH